MGEKFSQIWFVSCPCCRRRFFCTYLLRNFASDFRPIDYPVSYGHSLGRYGTTIDERITWPNTTELPSEVFEALQIFVRRLLNTYGILQALFSERSYVDAYGKDTIAEYIAAYALTRSLPDIVEPHCEFDYPEAYAPVLINIRDV